MTPIFAILAEMDVVEFGASVSASAVTATESGGFVVATQTLGNCPQWLTILTAQTTLWEKVQTMPDSCLHKEMLCCIEPPCLRRVEFQRIWENWWAWVRGEL
ncbi:MAG TPA: hypothetical protein PLJ71_20785, partial [Candidatus Hydrogenedentes bacterium]|nr:hypothetical protein [Candidatus Hydrogenedentota bacterium]